MVFDRFKQLGDLKRMRDQARTIQRELAQIEVMVEKDEMAVRVSGDQKLKSLIVNGEEQKKLVEVINQALKKAQEKAAHRMQGMMGDLSGLLKK